LAKKSLIAPPQTQFAPNKIFLFYVIAAVGATFHQAIKKQTNQHAVKDHFFLVETGGIFAFKHQ
jgi:hypothetical protein